MNIDQGRVKVGDHFERPVRIDTRPVAYSLGQKIGGDK